MSTTMRVVLLVLVLAAVAAGIWFGSWLFDTVTAPDDPALSTALGAALRR